MKKDYKPIDGEFRNCLETAAIEKNYVNLHYFTEIHEFMKVMVVVKNILMKGEVEFLALSNGEEIRLDQIIRIDETIAPQFTHIEDFTCDC